LGKLRNSYFESFNQDFSSDVIECLKDAAVYDSRSKVSHRSQDLYPSRNGVVRKTSNTHKKRGPKKRKSPESDKSDESDKLLSPLLKKQDIKADETNLDLDVSANSIAEVEEKVRSIKAQRLADAMNHPSYAKLEQEQKDLIKHEWVSSLLGLDEK
jgi:hypothetical protein